MGGSLVQLTGDPNRDGWVKWFKEGEGTGNGGAPVLPPHGWYTREPFSDVEDGGDIKTTKPS